MRKVLEEDTIYPYLKSNAKQRLDVARRVARNTGMLDRPVVSLGGYTRCIFPWLGTRSFRTLRKFIQRHSKEFGITGIEFEGCYYITFKMERDRYDTLMTELFDIVRREGGIDRRELVEGGEIPIFDKYDPFIPPSLLRSAYAEDRLRSDEVEKRIFEMLQNERK